MHMMNCSRTTVSDLAFFAASLSSANPPASTRIILIWPLALVPHMGECRPPLTTTKQLARSVAPLCFFSRSSTLHDGKWDRSVAANGICKPGCQAGYWKGGVWRGGYKDSMAGAARLHDSIHWGPRSGALPRDRSHHCERRARLAAPRQGSGGPPCPIKRLHCSWTTIGRGHVISARSSVGERVGRTEESGPFD